MFYSKSKDIVKLMTLHLDVVEKTFDSYARIIPEFSAGSDEQKTGWMDEVDKNENEADQVRHEIIQKLLMGGLLADSRKSFARIIEDVDQIANQCEHIVQEIYYQYMVLPPEVVTGIVEMNKVTKVQLTKLIGVLQSIVSQYHFKETLEQIREIEELESEVDHIEHKTMQMLYKSERPLAEKNQLKDIIRKVGHIADIIEDISDEIEIILMVRRV